MSIQLFLFDKLLRLRMKRRFARDPDVLEVSRMINSKLDASWKANKIIHSHYIDDYEFIRRASLDIIGRIATLKEIDTFMADPAERRRSLLIERLLKSPEFGENFGNLWTVMLLTVCNSGCE